MREIARRLGRAPSTISRELRRHAATKSGRLRVPGDHCAVARGAGEEGTEQPRYARERSLRPLLSGFRLRPLGRLAPCFGREARGTYTITKFSQCLPEKPQPKPPSTSVAHTWISIAPAHCGDFCGDFARRSLPFVAVMCAIGGPWRGPLRAKALLEQQLSEGTRERLFP